MDIYSSIRIEESKLVETTELLRQLLYKTSYLSNKQKGTINMEIEGVIDNIKVAYNDKRREILDRYDNVGNIVDKKWDNNDTSDKV